MRRAEKLVKTVFFKLNVVYNVRNDYCLHRLRINQGRLANRPGMAGIVLELTHGVQCPGRCSFCPGNVKINHRASIYGCSLMSVLYLVLCLSVTHNLT